MVFYELPHSINLAILRSVNPLPSCRPSLVSRPLPPAVLSREPPCPVSLCQWWPGSIADVWTRSEQIRRLCRISRLRCRRSVHPVTYRGEPVRAPPSWGRAVSEPGASRVESGVEPVRALSSRVRAGVEPGRAGSSRLERSRAGVEPGRVRVESVRAPPSWSRAGSSAAEPGSSRVELLPSRGRAGVEPFLTDAERVLIAAEPPRMNYGFMSGKLFNQRRWLHRQWRWRRRWRQR